eukprot:PITA_01674
MCWIGLLKYKYEEFENFKAFKALVENDSDRKIKCLRSDRGGEFTSDEFFDFCEQHGIKRQFSTARALQQKGVIKIEGYDNEEDGDYFPTSNHIESEEETNEAPEEEITIEEKTPSSYVQKSHPETQILREKEAGVQIRRTIIETSSSLALLSSTKPQNVNEACKDECWVKAMNEELEQIEKNNTWELVPRPHDKNIIGTK